MKVKSVWTWGRLLATVRVGAGDDESKRRLGACGLPRDLLLQGATKCAARCRARALLLLPVRDGAFVGALGLQRELALGWAHRVVGRPDTAAALMARRAGGELEPAHLLPRQRRLREGVVLCRALAEPCFEMWPWLAGPTPD